MTTTEKNKLIAEFMSTENPFNKGHYICPNGIATKPEDMKFHSSWDWLMPVVEKIESLYFWVEILGGSHNTCIIGVTNGQNSFIYFDSEDKKEAVYNACITFILWYNENSAKENKKIK